MSTVRFIEVERTAAKELQELARSFFDASWKEPSPDKQKTTQESAALFYLIARESYQAGDFGIHRIPVLQHSYVGTIRELVGGAGTLDYTLDHGHRRHYACAKCDDFHLPEEDGSIVCPFNVADSR